MLKIKKYCKVRDNWHYTKEYRGAAHSKCNLRNSVPKKILIAFHNWSNHEYHFIIKELAEKFEKQLTCLGENTSKSITFIAPIEKEFKITDKIREEITNISFRLQFIDSAKFMASPLSNLVNKLSEGIHKSQCKYGHDDKKCKTFRIKYKCCDCFLEYKNFKDDLRE